MVICNTPEELSQYIQECKRLLDAIPMVQPKVYHDGGKMYKLAPKKRVNKTNQISMSL